MVESREIGIVLFLAGTLAAIPSIVSPTIALQATQIIASFTSAFFFYYGTIAPRRWKPNFDLAMSVTPILPGFGLRSQTISQPVAGKILLLEVTNSIKSRVNANHCRAKLLVEGVTSGDEYIPWRYIEVASGMGSSWRQFHDREILRGDTGLLALCWAEKGKQAGYLQTSSPQVQWNPYPLKLGLDYKCKLTIFGDFKASVYEFSFNCKSEDEIRFTVAKKV
jgi:hypothetical protein